MKQVWKWGIFIFTSLLVALVVLEVVISRFLPAPVFERIQIFSDGAEYRLSPNRKLIYEPIPNTQELNEYGARGAACRVNRVAGKYRFLFIGDSVLEGLGVDPGDRYTEQLQNRFGGRYEFINLGVRGYNLIQEIEYLRLKGIRFRPDHVVINLIYNDFDMEGGELQQLSEVAHKLNSSAFYQHYYRANTMVSQILFRLHSYRYLRYFLTIHQQNPEAGVPFTKAEGTLSRSFDNNVKREDIHASLSELDQLAQEYSFEVTVLLLPASDEVRYLLDDLQTLISERGYRMLDLNNTVRERITPDQFPTLLFDSCHLTPEGHKLIADILAEKIPELSTKQNKP